MATAVGTRGHCDSQCEPEMTGHRAATLLRATLERPDTAAVFVRHRIATEALIQDLLRLP